MRLYFDDTFSNKTPVYNTLENNLPIYIYIYIYITELRYCQETILRCPNEIK